MNDHVEGETYIPTPAEIELACAEIKMGWSDQERIARRRWKPGKAVDAEGVEQVARQRLEAKLLSRRQGRG